MKISDTEPNSGDKVFIIGFPSGRAKTLITCEIESVGPQEIRYIRLLSQDIDCHGMSGGALLDSDGNLIGVNVRGNDKFKGFAVNLTGQIRTVLQL